MAPEYTDDQEEGEQICNMSQFQHVFQLAIKGLTSTYDYLGTKSIKYSRYYITDIIYSAVKKYFTLFV